jgi:hypothetical protein
MIQGIQPVCAKLIKVLWLLAHSGSEEVIKNSSRKNEALLKDFNSP